MKIDTWKLTKMIQNNFDQKIATHLVDGVKSSTNAER